MRSVITLAPTEQDKAISPTCGGGRRRIHILPPPPPWQRPRESAEAQSYTLSLSAQSEVSLTNSKKKKKKNTLKFYGKREKKTKKKHVLSSFINLENYSARVAANYDLMWSEKRMWEIQELAGTVTISFSAVFPNTEAEKWEGGKSSKRKEKRGDGKGLKMGLVVLACDKRETSTRR